jgi:GNAT superfamily N-acetyltransferase
MALMSADERVSPVQFGPYRLEHEKTPELHGVYASHEGKGIGEIEWDSGNGSRAFGLSPHEVRWVGVDDAHQGNGVASRMWEFAKSVDPDIKHSRELSESGTGWAKKVGD